MSDLNIVTVAHGEEWLDYHLRRFLWQARKTNPMAKYYLIIPYSRHARADALVWRDRLAPHFAAIAITEIQDMPGRLVYYDRLRAASLEAFDLDECLYIDADTDIMTDLGHVRYLEPDANLLWTPNAVHKDEVQNELTVHGLDSTPPFADPGFLYMRRSYAAEFEQARQDYAGSYDAYVPGMSMWNVAMRRAGDTAMLSYNYNVMYFVHRNLQFAQVIHFGGDRGTVERKWYDLSGHPTKLELRLQSPVEPDLRW
jgi:hypothetical protein